MNHSAPSKPASLPHRTSNVTSKLLVRLAAHIEAKKSHQASIKLQVNLTLALKKLDNRLQQR